MKYILLTLCTLLISTSYAYEPYPLHNWLKEKQIEQNDQFDRMQERMDRQEQNRIQQDIARSLRYRYGR